LSVSTNVSSIYHHGSTVPVSSEILTVYGLVSGATGTFTLTSDLVVTGVAKIVIPKGCTLKIWTREVSGAAGGVSVNYQYAQNGTVFATMVTDVLPSAGELDIEKRRPHAFRSNAGTEAIQITYTGGTSGQTVTFDLEITQDN
jgi:hypothetical protein